MTSSSPAPKKTEAKKPVDTNVTDNESANVQAKKPEHLGTHPGSFEMFNLERNFKPTDDPDLDERGRWIANEFFASHGPTTVVRLDELTNLGDKSYEGRGDSSDRELSRQIMMRAGLGDHPRFNQLVDMMAVGLGEIDDPGKWLHGYADYSNSSTSERKGENSSSSSSTAG
jgi:hypothetical protein